MVTIKVEVTREISAGDLLGRPLRDFLKAGQYAVHASAAQPGIVPIDEGYLRGYLGESGGGWDMDGADVPLWARVGVPESSGVPGSNWTAHDYGLALHNSPRYHYRMGPASGSETAGWLQRGADGATGEITGPLLVQLGKDIEGAWRA